jgi:hypothetical protein
MLCQVRHTTGDLRGIYTSLYVVVFASIRDRSSWLVIHVGAYYTMSLVYQNTKSTAAVFAWTGSP